MRRFFLCSAIACALVQFRCSNACPADNPASFFVEIKDAKTRLSICDAGVVARDGTFSERLIEGCFISGPLNRAGTYRLTVQRAGYVTKEESVVVGPKDQCGRVSPPQIQIFLDLDPSASVLDAGTD